jgi:hypothetical protein
MATKFACHVCSQSCDSHLVVYSKVMLMRMWMLLHWESKIGWFLLRFKKGIIRMLVHWRNLMMIFEYQRVCAFWKQRKAFEIVQFTANASNDDSILDGVSL